MICRFPREHVNTFFQPIFNHTTIFFSLTHSSMYSNNNDPISLLRTILFFLLSRESCLNWSHLTGTSKWSFPVVSRINKNRFSRKFNRLIIKLTFWQVFSIFVWSHQLSIYFLYRLFLPDNKIFPISPAVPNFFFKGLLTENPTLFRNWFLAMKKKLFTSIRKE